MDRRSDLKRSAYDIALPETLTRLDHRSIGDMARAEFMRPCITRSSGQGSSHSGTSTVKRSQRPSQALSAHAAGAKFYALKRN